ncbi:hypothetical protein GCM10011608_43510 [Micromonospora sonchi]|uniref:Uncharacterized protein n=1 Tax=Micromonospora sonchi TaxID=1763543 RepID=A0A917U4Z6_9ACTN|nr:DUF6244 family protein [Micromonospora sonchi]GGM53871.1 hypothetical protein GCM10011608_43510 [Micromonospora sonchi]
MSAAQIIAQLTAASRKLEEAQAQIAAARQNVGEARQLTAGALQGSSGQLTSQFDSLIEVIGQVGTRPAAVKEQVHATIAKVQALGN